MEQALEFLAKLDITTIIAVAAMFWWFNTRMDKKFEKIDQKFEKIDQRFDKVYNEFDKLKVEIGSLKNDMIEVKTVLRLKECCMINDDRQIKKAE
jgi:septal ring factor EnvC (AmiA/AmiB activator)